MGRAGTAWAGAGAAQLLSSHRTTLGSLGSAQAGGIGESLALPRTCPALGCVKLESSQVWLGEAAGTGPAPAQRPFAGHPGLSFGISLHGAARERASARAEAGGAFGWGQLVPEPPRLPWTRAYGVKQAAERPCNPARGKPRDSVRRGEGRLAGEPRHLPRDSPGQAQLRSPRGGGRGTSLRAGPAGQPSAGPSRRSVRLQQQEGHFPAQGKGCWGGNCSRTKAGNGNSGYR